MEKYCEFIEVYKTASNAETYQTSKLSIKYLDHQLRRTIKCNLITIAIFKIKCNDKKL